jgi:two-component system chemotaxis response regulator CheB
VVGVVLTGNLDDGTAGAFAVKSRGGTVLVQDPGEAMYPGMPTSAIAGVDVDQVLTVAEISAALARLAATPVPEGEEEPVSDEMDEEVEASEMDPSKVHATDHPGAPSGFTCPECHGVLWELNEGDVLRFRCRVGHAYGVETLLSEQEDSLEAALWTALKALEERASLAQRMARRMEERAQHSLALRYHEQREEVTLRAEVIRRVLLQTTRMQTEHASD